MEEKNIGKIVCLIFTMVVVFFAGCQKKAKPLLTETERLNIEKAVLQKHADFIGFAEQRDVNKMFSIIPNDNRASIIQDGRLLTRQEALETVGNGFKRTKELKYEFDQQHVTVLSHDIAFLTGRGRSITTTNTGETSTLNFATTVIFVLEQNEWKMLHGHLSIPFIN
ncbi:MAG: nuclear transport factor 2 family protein [Planctomycetota bacterium]